MPKTAKALTATQVRRISEVGLHPVGGVPGLYLQVTRYRVCSWILRASIGGRVRYAGLGPYPEVTLKRAREKAKDARDAIRDGRDPIEERRQEKAALAAARAKQLTFREAAKHCFDANSPNWSSATHKRDWLASLQRHAFPVLGPMGVADIELPHVLRVLEPIWQTKTRTARSVRERIELTLGWATISGYRQGDNPARWEGYLDQVLPDPSRFYEVTHMRALPWADMPDFMAKLREREGVAARCLELIVLTASRGIEIRASAPSEVDFDARTLSVPSDRMKGRRPHTIPLCDDACALLKVMPRDGDWIFPNQRGNGPVSGMALRRVLDDMGVDVTIHGFRSSFKDWARSRTKYPDEVSELQLAHVNNDATRAAYARDELLPQRAKLMRDWAKFLREGKAPANTNNVTSIGTAAQSP